jgi:subtilisin family serine protease
MMPKVVVIKGARNFGVYRRRKRGAEILNSQRWVGGPLWLRRFYSPLDDTSVAGQPVAADHPDLAQINIRELPGKMGTACAQTRSAACVHGTFVAGILSAKRGSTAPAICPDCTLLVNPVFSETATGSPDLPSSTPEKVASAILECIEAGARVLNLSLAVARCPSKDERALKLALDHAARRGVIIVAAAGNQGTVGGTTITSHPWVIAVAACDPARLAPRP